MSHTYINRTLGFDVNVVFNYDTPEDYDKAVGQVNAWRETVDAQECYQGVNNLFRPRLGKALEDLVTIKGFDLPRLVTGSKKGKDDAGNEVEIDIYESEADYLKRIRADGRISNAELAALAQEVQDGINPVTPQPGGRKTGPTKKHYELADRYLAAISDGQSTAERVMSNLSAKIGRDFESSFGSFDRDSLARALQAKEQVEARQLDL